MIITEESLKKECFDFLNKNEDLDKFIKKEKSKLIDYKKSYIGKKKTFTMESISKCIFFFFFFIMCLAMFTGHKNVVLYLFLSGLSPLFLMLIVTGWEEIIKGRIRDKIKNKIINFLLNKHLNTIDDKDIVKEIYDYKKQKNFLMLNERKMNIFKDVEIDFLRLSFYSSNEKIINKKIIADESIAFKVNELQNKYLLENNKG